MLQTKVDAQCDKLATELSWQCLRRSTFASYSKLFVKSRQFSPTPPTLGTSIVPRLSCDVACVILCLAVSVEHWQTDRHTTTTYTALAWCRAVKTTLQTLFIAACTSRNKQDWNSFQLELGLPAKFHGKNHMTETANIQIIKTAQQINNCSIVTVSIINTKRYDGFPKINKWVTWPTPHPFWGCLSSQS